MLVDYISARGEVCVAVREIAEAFGIGRTIAFRTLRTLVAAHT